MRSELLVRGELWGDLGLGCRGEEDRKGKVISVDAALYLDLAPGYSDRVDIRHQPVMLLSFCYTISLTAVSPHSPVT